MPVAKKNTKLTPAQEDKLHVAMIKQLLTLTTAGFGLVAALSWNDTVKTLIDEWVKPYVSKGSGLGWQFLYALIATALAVSLTYYLTKLVHRFEKK